MRRLIATTAAVLICSRFVLSQESSKPAIDVSFWSSSADLSAYYQQIVREGTEAYIGDLPPSGSVTIVRHVVRYYDSTGNVYTVERVGGNDQPVIRTWETWSSQLVSPFPNVPLKLRRAVKAQDRDSASVALQRSALE
jgi:hypothetical protein